MISNELEQSDFLIGVRMIEFIFIYEKREGLAGRYYTVGTREEDFEGI